MTLGTINLRLTQPNGQASRFDVLAQIEPIGLVNPGRAQSVIIAADATRGLDVQVNPGEYVVKLYLPGGGVLQDDCVVVSGLNAPMEFALPSQRSQAFSLQEVIGSSLLSETLDDVIGAREATGKPPSAKPSKRSAKVASPPKRIAKLSGVRTATPKRAVGVGGSGKRAAAARVPNASTPALYILAGGAATRLKDWTIFGMAGDDLSEFATRDDRQKPIFVRDGAAIWRLHSDAQETTGRSFALIDLGSAYELAALPMPWRCVGRGNFSAIDLAVDTTLGGRAATSIAVHDQAIDALLSYLAPGQIRALGKVMEVFETEGLIEQIIADKAANPIAACAAAYAGLALFEPSQQERWDSWLPNLMDRFPWLPDGAIVHARRIMLRPHSQDPSAALIEALRKAVAAGLPYFGVGLQLLRDMLQVASVEHDDAKALLEQIAPAAARLDPRQLFTVLRFPRMPA